MLSEKELKIVDEMIGKIELFVNEELRDQCVSLCSQMVDMIAVIAKRSQADVDLIDSLDSENRKLRLQLQKIEIEKELECFD